MSRRRLAISFAVICATLVFPRQARAGLADIIWEMSGPQMVGAIVKCRVSFGGGQARCQLALPIALAPPDAQPANAAPQKNQSVNKRWLALEGGVYGSTGLNNGGVDYKAGRIVMFAFEPMLEFRYEGSIEDAYKKHSGVGAIYAGVGPVINRFLVKGATPAFMKYGVKVRPIAMMVSGWTIEYNLRLYAHGFSPDEFGFGGPIKVNRPEVVQSVSILVPWLQWAFGK